MAEDKSQEKTEQPTPKRRQDARKKGQVAKSREISSVSILMGSLLLLYLTAGFFIQNILSLTGGVFSLIGEFELNEVTVSSLSLILLRKLFIILIPLMLVVLVLGITTNLFQVGFLVTGEPIVPKFSKINPISGLKRVVSRQSLIELVKSIFKITVVGYVAYGTVKNEFSNITCLANLEVWEILVYIGRISFKIIFNTSLILITLAAFDYFYQRWEHERGLRMTHQEVREEFKQREGDPMIKARIKSIQREMARRRMISAVPKADVVITNPDHLAVALGYDHGNMEAPQVLAKGAGFIAEQIKKIARKNNIPMVENKGVAQVLFKACEVGQTIPVNLYKTIAEILAYVYRIKGKAPAGSKQEG